jgi:hypothetical protein
LSFHLIVKVITIWIIIQKPSKSNKSIKMPQLCFIDPVIDHLYHVFPAYTVLSHFQHKWWTCIHQIHILRHTEICTSNISIANNVRAFFKTQRRSHLLVPTYFSSQKLVRRIITLCLSVIIFAFYLYFLKTVLNKSLNCHDRCPQIKISPLIKICLNFKDAQCRASCSPGKDLQYWV